MINPGSRPVDGGTESGAEANLQEFVDEATTRGLRLSDEPIRHAEADADGRYGWVLPLEGGDQVPILMPGTDLATLRDDLSSEAYCLKVRDSWWWWRDAVGMVVPIEPGRQNQS